MRGSTSLQLMPETVADAVRIARAWGRETPERFHGPSGDAIRWLADERERLVALVREMYRLTEPDSADGTTAGGPA